MALSYLPVDREQLFLLPPDMREWLPEGHLVWLVLDVVERVDTSGLHAGHANVGAGRRAYDPEMLLALLVYAYCTGVRSSRRIERLCEVDVAYRVVCGGWVPDHTTIARFRQGFGAVAVGLFADVLELCARVGLVKVGVVAVDGTKMGADASLQANVTRGQLEALVAGLFAQAEEVDVEEDRLFGDGRGDELPEGLRDRQGRAARLEEALRELEDRPEEQAERSWELGGRGAARHHYHRDRDSAQRRVVRAEEDLAALEAELAGPEGGLAQAEAELAEVVKAHEAAGARRVGPKRGGRGKTSGGRGVAAKVRKRDRQVALAQRRRAHAEARVAKAKARAAEVQAREEARVAAAKARAEGRTPRVGPPKVNVTDPDSRIMKSPRGWVQGYNAQAAVNPAGIVVAGTVTTEHSDAPNLVPMMSAVQANLEVAGAGEPVGVMLFDAGYFSHANVTAAGPSRLIATTKSWKLRRAAIENGYTQGELPADASPVQAMEHRLRSEEGARLYGMRQHMIEPVFAHTKHNRGYTRFMRRGLSAVQAEWQLILTTHNLLKLHRAGPSLAI